MTIKTLCICGGGPNILLTYGALKSLANNKFFNIENIENVYAISAGALCITMLLLINNWSISDKYIEDCPWDEYINISLDKLLLLYNKTGILGEKEYIRILSPLLKMNHLDENISLKDFCDAMNINFYLSGTNLTDFKLELFSNLTHPDIEFKKALQITSSLPIIVEPVYYNDKIYIDGGVFTACLLNYCLDNKDINENEILCIRNKYNQDKVISTQNINSCIDYLLYLFVTISNNIKVKHAASCKNIVYLPYYDFNSYTEDNKIIFNILSDKKSRKAIIQKGEEAAELFMLYNKIMP